MIVSWIRHRANASTSGKVLELQRRMGLEGIGLYWLAFEFFLAEGGRFKWTDTVADTLAFGWRVEPEPVRDFLVNSEELGIIGRQDDYLIFFEVVEELERAGRVAEGRKQAASIRWGNDHANAMQMHSKCTAPAMQNHAEREREERERIEERERGREGEAPVIPPIQLSDVERKALLEQMSADELAYWARCIGLYRLRRPETAGDHDWASIQRWRDRAIAEGQTWSAEKKTYLTKRAQDPPDERAREKARILELKKKFQEEENRVALKK